MLTLVMSGALTGILAFTGVEMLLARDLPGDTASPQFAGVLLACSLVMAITGFGVATGRSWSPRLSLVVGLTCVIAGFGGLLFLVVASLLALGTFPATLLAPLNLTISFVMAFAGVTGTWLLIERSDPPVTVTTGSRLVGSWHPVAAGIALGIAAAWIWSALIWPLIPYECCLA